MARDAIKRTNSYSCVYILYLRSSVVARHPVVRRFRSAAHPTARRLDPISLARRNFVLRWRTRDRSWTLAEVGFCRGCRITTDLHRPIFDSHLLSVKRPTKLVGRHFSASCLTRKTLCLKMSLETESVVTPTPNRQ